MCVLFIVNDIIHLQLLHFLVPLLPAQLVPNLCNWKGGFVESDGAAHSICHVEQSTTTRHSWH